MALDNVLKIYDEQGNPVDYDILASDVKFQDGKDLPTKLTELEGEIGEGGYAPPAGGIPKTDLSSDVQTSLDKADTAYQKPASGIPATDLADGVIPDVSGFATKTEVNTGLAGKVDKNGTDSLMTAAEHTKLAGLPTSTELVNTYATKTELAGKVDKVTGKGLSTNDYTDAEKSKLAGIAAGAEVNVQSDWNASSGDAAILNKPTILTEQQVQGMIDEAVEDLGSGTVESVTIGGTKHLPDENGDVDLGNLRGQDGNSGVASADGVESVNNLNGGTTDTSSKVYVLGANQGKRLRDQIDYVYARLQAVYAAIGNIAFWDGKTPTANILPELDWGVPKHTVTLALSLTNTTVKHNGVVKSNGDTIQVEESSTLTLIVEPATSLMAITSVTSSTTGATVTDLGNGTYSVAIVMGGSNVTLNVVASASVEDYDVPVGGEMVFFLDGTDLTDGTTTWVDKVGNVQFSGSGSVVKVDGVPVGMSFNSQVMSIDSTLNFSPVTHTIEVVAKPISVNYYKYNYLFSDGTQTTDNGGKSEAIHAILYKDGNDMYMNGVLVDGTGTQNQDGSWTNGHVWSMPFTLDSNICIGANKTCAVNNGVQMSSTGDVHWTSIYGKAALAGARNNKNGFFYSDTVVYAIRIYRGQLTAEQMLHNQKIDNIRYKLGLTLPDSVS